MYPFFPPSLFSSLLPFILSFSSPFLSHVFIKCAYYYHSIINTIFSIPCQIFFVSSCKYLAKNCTRLCGHKMKEEWTNMFLNRLTSARDDRIIINLSNYRSRLHILFLKWVWTPEKYLWLLLYSVSAALWWLFSHRWYFDRLQPHILCHCNIELPGPCGRVMAKWLL